MITQINGRFFCKRIWVPWNRRTTEIQRVPGFIDDHLPAVLDFVSMLPDLSATVLGPDGEPIDAEIQLLAQGTPFGQPFRSEPGTGALHRLLDARVTGFEVRADGYHGSTTDLGSEVAPLQPDQLDGRPFLPARSRFS